MLHIVLLYTYVRELTPLRKRQAPSAASARLNDDLLDHLASRAHRRVVIIDLHPAASCVVATQLESVVVDPILADRIDNRGPSVR
jgi:hypothetical protein